MSAIRSPLATVLEEQSTRLACRPAFSRATSVEVARFAAILEEAETEIVAIVVDVVDADAYVYPADLAHTLRPSVSSLTGALVHFVEACGWRDGLSAKTPSALVNFVEAFGTIEGSLRSAQGFSQPAFAGLLRAYHSAYVGVLYESLLDWETARRYRAVVDRFFDCLRQADIEVKFPHPRSEAAAGRVSGPTKPSGSLAAPWDDSGGGTAVVLLDASGRLEWANHAAARLFGLGAALREPLEGRPGHVGSLGLLEREIEAFIRSSTPEFILVWQPETAIGRRACSAHFVRRPAPDGSCAGVTIAFDELGIVASDLAYKRDVSGDKGTTVEIARQQRHQIISAVRGAATACALGASLLLLLLFVQSANASSRFVSPDVSTHSSLNNGAWQWQNPLPHGNRLIDTVALSDVAALALDADGRVLRTDDGGLNWTVRDTRPEGDLESLAAADLLHFWAVGSYGTLMYTNDGGITWKERSAPTDVTLHAVAFATGLRGYAVGDDGVVLRTVDGGLTWRSIFSTKCTPKRGVYIYRVLAVDGAGNSQSVMGVGRLTVT